MYLYKTTKIKLTNTYYYDFDYGKKFYALAIKANNLTEIQIYLTKP